MAFLRMEKLVSAKGLNEISSDTCSGIAKIVALSPDEDAMLARAELTLSVVETMSAS